MPKSSVNASLSSYDDIFSTEESRLEEQREQVQQIPIGELFPFKNHPFKVLDDDSMSDTVESVKQYGVLSPLIARPRPKGGYEIISGHRRQHAAELAGLETLPVIVRQMDDDAAIILMVDSNLQREHILPSERAFAYKMKLDAMKNQGTRSDLTSTQVVSKLRSNEKLGAENNQSRETVRRFIRLTNLIPELLDMVDNKTVSFNPAVELSYLSPEQQQEVIRAMDDTQNFPSVSQAKRIKKLAQDGTFTTETVIAIMGEEKKSELDTVTIKNDTLRKYFPRSYTP
ncbi:ParB/RepB/Spo0J family partition protein, partial [Faecalibacterium sp.]|uniref:ParB/RepB/Spo0J family partition protein n=1 Tax=Faecalibacterium sp. TaxID=1971605 RepID=UPI003A92A95E